jgi:hypothetical protein
MGVPGAYDLVLDALRKVYRPHIAVEVMLIGIPAGVLELGQETLEQTAPRQLPPEESPAR